MPSCQSWQALNLSLSHNFVVNQAQNTCLEDDMLHLSIIQLVSWGSSEQQHRSGSHQLLNGGPTTSEHWWSVRWESEFCDAYWPLRELEAKRRSRRRRRSLIVRQFNQIRHAAERKRELHVMAYLRSECMLKCLHSGLLADCLVGWLAGWLAWG